MQCQVIRLCSLGAPVSIQWQHHLFPLFRHHTQQANFLNSAALLFSPINVFFFFLSVLICLCIYLVVGCNLWFVCCGWWNFELWIKLFHNIKWVPIRVLSRFFHCNLLSQVWQVQFPHSLSLYFLLILLSSCKVVVLTKILDEGLIRSVARTCWLVVVFFPNPLEPLLSWCFLI